jgi:tRNA (guanine37-N1)-methyltransferase
MKIDIITIFPQIFDSYLKESLIARAQKKRLINITVNNLRKWTNDPHKTVDDRPFGGGLGMVLKVEPLYKAIKALKKKSAKVILFTPRGKKFSQKMAFDLSKEKHLILICGRYEGVDERVAQHLVDEEISIGDFDMMGGELPAMVLTEVVARLVPGVLGKPQLLKERITKGKGFIEYAQYTRPEVFKGWKVPKVLLSGNHQKVEEWRQKHGKAIE